MWFLLNYILILIYLLKFTDTRIGPFTVVYGILRFYCNFRDFLDYFSSTREKRILRGLQ
jgi:hypothetical protein